MSWHYLQGREVESWGENSLAGAPDVLLRLMPIAEKSCCKDNETGYSISSQSGTTSKHSMVNHGGDTSTLSAVDSPVRTYHVRESKRGYTENVHPFGLKWQESLAIYDHDLSLWKTRQISLFEDYQRFSDPWPRWGIMHGGVCWELDTLEPHTNVIGCGSLPIPTSSQYGTNKSLSHGAKVRPSLETMAKKNLWPTPTVHGNNNRKGVSKKSGDGLATSVRKYSTPTCNDAKNNGSASQQKHNTPPLNVQIGGPLNPDWVEWLMGWPIGWTDLKQLEMDKFQQWLDLLGTH